MKKTLLAAMLAATAAAAPAAAATVYTNDFDAPPTTASGVVASLTGITGTGTANTPNGYGLAGSFLRNDSFLVPGTTNAAPTLLTLSNLPTHSSVSLGFVLAFLDSWDSTNGSVAPDYFTLTADGVAILNQLTTFSGSGSITNYAGGTVLGQNVQADTNFFYTDSTVGFSGLSFAHSASTLTLAFYAGGNGWQGGSDESFGVDGLTVAVNGVAPVPEPASWAMMIGGFGLVGGAMRRRTRTAVRFA